jgi:hypothetical protein
MSRPWAACSATWLGARVRARWPGWPSTAPCRPTPSTRCRPCSTRYWAWASAPTQWPPSTRHPARPSPVRPTRRSASPLPAPKTRPHTARRRPPALHRRGAPKIRRNRRAKIRRPEPPIRRPAMRPRRCRKTQVRRLRAVQTRNARVARGRAAQHRRPRPDLMRRPPAKGRRRQVGAARLRRNPVGHPGASDASAEPSAAGPSEQPQLTVAAAAGSPRPEGSLVRPEGCNCDLEGGQRTREEVGQTVTRWGAV